MDENNLVIPGGYNGESTITPIFLVTIQNGTAINPALLAAVEKQHRALCRLAKQMLGDVTKVSDLAQAAVNRVHARQLRGADVDNENAGFLIYGAARAIARAWRYRAAQESRRWVSFETTASLRHERSTLAVENEYIAAIDADAIIAKLMKGLSPVDRRIVQLYLRGLNYVEITAVLQKNPPSRHCSTVRSVVLNFQRRASAIT